MVARDGTTTTLAAVPHHQGWLRRRLAGPGGLYNLGNAIGLAAGLLIQVGSSGPALTVADTARSVAAYLAGNGAALALTLATLVFFWSGEAYHRAFSGREGPDARLLRHGDILSGIGATLLGAGLFALGDPVLAVSSGLLHALGKFGSAVDFTRLGASRERGAELHVALRWTVVASRVPALLVAVVGLVAIATVPAATPAAAPMLLTLLACYALWTLADLLLLRPARS